MRKLTRIEFALINIAIFILALPAYLVWGGPSSPLVLRILLIVVVGAPGWFGVGFLVLGFLSKVIDRK
jgi:hypothetical protein